MKNYTKKAMIARVVRECERLWRQQILVRAGGHCEICGAPRPEDIATGKWIIIAACHIVTRGNHALRCDVRNGVAGCSDCHNHKTIMTWLEKTDPARFKWILEQKREYVSRREIDWEEILRNLRAA